MKQGKQEFSVLAVLICGVIACGEDGESSGAGAAGPSPMTGAPVPVAPASGATPLGAASGAEPPIASPVGNAPAAEPAAAKDEQSSPPPAEEQPSPGVEVEPPAEEVVPPEGEAAEVPQAMDTEPLAPKDVVAEVMPAPVEDPPPPGEEVAAPVEDTPPAPATPSAPEEPAPAGLTGEAFYMAACAACHGPTGDGTAKGPDVKHPVEAFSVHAIRNGMGPDMMPYGEEVLSEELLQEVLAFLDAPPQPTDGEGLYMDYCAACHGDDARGGRTRVSIIRDAEDFAMDIRGGHHEQDGPGHQEYMPSWTAEQISDAEIELMIQFVQGL